ncbi:MAG: cytochrome c biogenesis protein [Pseudanabaenaceae cyanobacterium bins.68]|nr:cytochrome c biogenesis protein [Pseudanabaenaceae cyanobacterium bins.68]
MAVTSKLKSQLKFQIPVAWQRSWHREILPLMGSLQLAIALLLLIAGFSIFGTVIEQSQDLAFYQANYPEHPALFGFLSYRVLLVLGLNHVYSTWWFLSLLLLFGASLTACTFKRQLPMLRVARRWFFYTKPESISKLPLYQAFPTRSLQELDQLFGLAKSKLLAQKYQVFSESGRLYARKGLIGRLGPILVHASMLLILVGAIAGALTGFVAQEMIPSGETFQVKNITEAGIWSQWQIPQDWAVKVNRFWIDYSSSGKISQFYSDLSVVDQEGNELKRETIRVNQPLRYGGVTFYQANWDIASVRFTLNRSPILQLPLQKISPNLWATWIPTQPDLSTGISLVTGDLQGTFRLYDQAGKLLATTRTDLPTPVNGISLTLKEVVGSTGLQIKADPGIPIVYLGFAGLMISVIMSYVSYSQVWLLCDRDRLHIGGKTNRAQVGFEAEMLEIFASLSPDHSLIQVQNSIL